MSEVKTPWKDYMGDVPMHLDYFQGSMFEAVERMAELYPNNIAFDFMGKSTTSVSYTHLTLPTIRLV